jgi:hypothetical protein
VVEPEAFYLNEDLDRLWLWFGIFVDRNRDDAGPFPSLISAQVKFRGSARVLCRHLWGVGHLPIARMVAMVSKRQLY